MTNHQGNKKTLFLYIVLFISLAIFGSAIGPDYWPYQRIVENVSLYGIFTERTHMEDVYLYILPYIGNNYTLFNICIYIPSFYMLFYVFSKFNHIQKNNIIIGLLFFSILGLYSALVSRQFLSTMFICVSILLYIEKRYIKTIIFIVLAVLFHKSAYILIPLLLLSFYWSLNRKKMLFLICILPIFIAIGYWLVPYIQRSLFVLDDMTKNGAAYMVAGDSQKEGSLWWTIIEIVQFGINIIIAIYVLKTLRNIQTKRIYVVLCNYLFWITYVGFLFYFLPLAHKGISLRTLYMQPIIISLLIPIVLPKTKQYLKSVIYLLLVVFWFLTNVYIRGVANGNLSYNL